MKVICNDRNDNSVTTNFIRATKTVSPNSHSGATSLTPVGNSLMYIETSSKKHGHERVIVSWVGTDSIQIIKIPFYYNRFSVLTNDSSKMMGRYRIQLLFEDSTWSSKY